MNGIGLNYDETPSKILDRLFLGNMMDAENKEALLKHGVKYVLVAGNYLQTYYPDV